MKASTIQTNFTGGEMTPKLHGRVDIAKYNNCARRLHNVIALIFGGAESRDGLLFVKSTKDSTRRSRLIPFVFNVNQSYVLEFGHLYMRVFTNNGQVESAPNVPYEIVTTITEAMLPALNFTQTADTMVLVHEDVYVQRLQRRGHANWFIENYPFTVPPLSDSKIIIPSSLTLSSTAVGPGRTFTAPGSIFLAADVGRTINSGSGVATITSVTGTVATCRIDAPFASTSIASGDWWLGGTPSTFVQVATVVSMYAGMTVTVTANAAAFRAADVGAYITTGYRTSSQGNAAYVITGYTNATTVTAIVLATNGDITWVGDVGAWAMRSASFNGPGEYPRSVCFKDQRLYLGGGIKNPSRIYASETGNILGFLNYTQEVQTPASFDYPTADTAGFEFKIAESQEPLMHLCNNKRLMALTLSGAFSIQGGLEKAVTPTNVQINDESDIGANNVRPVRIGNELYFAHRAGRKLFSSTYQITQEGFDSTDVSKIAEHIARVGLVEMAYQREPNSILYVVLADGTLATITIDREENVIAWARHTTDGLFESVACVPTATEEQVWVIVQRVINGVSVRQVERFSPDVVMDSAIVGNTPGGATVWAGLSHLVAKEVVVMADGKYAGKHIVNGAGEITLSNEATNVQIGLPFLQEIVLLPPEIASQTGSSQSKNYSINSVSVNVLETLGAKIYQGNKQSNAEMVGKLVYDVSNFDTPPPVFSGWHKISSLGQASNKEPEACTTTIYQEYPLKMHVRSVVREVTVND